MPILIYKCLECGHKFDEFYHKFTEELPKCPHCKSEQTKRLITKPAENPFGTVEGWFKFS